MTKRKSYSSELKSKVALAAIKGEQTSNELASKFGIHPNQVSSWKREAVQNLPLLFDSKSCPKSSKMNKEKEHLYSQIGRLKVEVNFLKKYRSLGMSTMVKKSHISRGIDNLPIARQCMLLGLSRASYCRSSSAERGESQENLLLMRLIDEEDTSPFL